VEHLRNALHEKYMTNIDFINILSIIFYNHNIFTGIQAKPKNKRWENVIRGLTQIYLPDYFKKSDDVAEKPDYYSDDNDRLDELTKEFVFHKETFCNKYINSIGYIIWYYDSNVSEYIAFKFGDVSKEAGKKIFEDEIV